MAKAYPPPIYSNQPGTWAHHTVTKRLPEIVRRVLRDNDNFLEIKNSLTELYTEMPGGSIRQLDDQQAPDWVAWQAYISPMVGRGWLEVPWFFAEHYFYRRIMEAVDYFESLKDPFGYQKSQGLEHTQQDIQVFAAYINDLDDNRNPHQPQEVLYSSLWGNQADLSLWPAGSQENPRHNSQQKFRNHLLADDTGRILQALNTKEPSGNRIDILLDNAGFELISDLGLADTLLKLKLAGEIVLHAKAHPAFVSDVIKNDVKSTLVFLAESSEPATRSLGIRLQQHIETGRISIRDHFFWNSPLPMWDLPEDLKHEFASSDLIISKGDANYRRLLGDREWDFTLPFSQVVDFLPAPLAALRTLKAELAVGLDLTQIQHTSDQDPNWLVDGKWGVIHFAPGND